MSNPPKPLSRFYATPAQIDAFLRQHFAEDVLLHFYNALGDEVLDEIQTSGKTFRGLKEQAQAKYVYLAGITDVLDYIQDDRYYPKRLPDMSSYTRPHKQPPRPVPAAEEASPEARMCFIKKPHAPHRWLYQRRAITCPGYSQP